MKMEVVRKFTFDAAHSLPEYTGKCRNLHGHSYVLYVGVKADVLKNGIGFDTSKLKKIVNKIIIDNLDHKYLNDVLTETPTMENILQWVLRQLQSNNGLPLSFLEIHETEKNYARLTLD